MRWLLTSRSSNSAWRLPLLQFLLLIALMIFVLATFAVLASQKEPQTADPPIPLSPVDPDPYRISLQTKIPPVSIGDGIRRVPLQALAGAKEPSLAGAKEQSLAGVQDQSLSGVLDQSLNGVASGELQPMAAPNAFSGTATISGAIQYFHGQTNKREQTLPLLPLAFLVGERIRVVMDFTAEPSSMTVTLNGLSMNVTGTLGQTHYETWLIVPNWERTIDWSGNRLQPTLTMNIHAISRADPLVATDIAIPGLDIGGSVYDMLIMQVA